jgi:hypothetical protein
MIKKIIIWSQTLFIDIGVSHSCLTAKGKVVHICSEVIVVICQSILCQKGIDGHYLLYQMIDYLMQFSMDCLTMTTA